MLLDKSLAFLDIDSLEYNTSHNSRMSILPNLSFRKRVLPLKDELNRLYAYACNNNHPIIFSTCCSGQSPSFDKITNICNISAYECCNNWKAKIHEYSMFFIEKMKVEYSNDFLKGMYDKFRLNLNFLSFVNALDPQEWVAFGNGAAFCLYPALMCIQSTGQKVTILSDILIDSASGYTIESPENLRQAMLENCAKEGATVCTLDEFCL